VPIGWVAVVVGIQPRHHWRSSLSTVRSRYPTGLYLFVPDRCLTWVRHGLGSERMRAGISAVFRGWRRCFTCPRVEVAWVGSQPVVDDRSDLAPESGDFDDHWQRVLMGEFMPGLSKYFRRLPGPPRCKACQAPFRGPFAPLLRLGGFRPWQLNRRLCHHCFNGIDKARGGAEVPVSLLFADVRGSTSLAEEMSARDFRTVLDRFYKLVFGAVDRNHGVVDHLAGDGVMALWTQRFGGKDHPVHALDAGREVVDDLTTDSVLRGRVPAGVGVHTGTAWVGVVGESGAHDFTVLGDAPNTVARLGSAAQTGELMVSSAIADVVGLDTRALEKRQLELKGKSEPFPAWVEKAHA
jgi:adenylate cyclase